MRDYLIGRGVPADRIVADSAGVDTWATARHASAYMREHGYARALAVTQYFHVPRTMLALRRHGMSRGRRASGLCRAARPVFAAASWSPSPSMPLGRYSDASLNDRALPC